jgi:hypothetical protein
MRIAWRITLYVLACIIKHLEVSLTWDKTARMLRPRRDNDGTEQKQQNFHTQSGNQTHTPNIGEVKDTTCL